MKFRKLYEEKEMTLAQKVLILTFTLFLHRTGIPQSYDVIPQTSHVNGTKTAVISPNGNYLVTSGFDCLIKIRRYPSGEVLGQIKTAPGIVNSIIFISDSKIMTGDSKGNLAVYDILTTEKIIARNISFQQINSVVYDRSSRLYWCAGFGGLLAAIEPDSLKTHFFSRGLAADINVADAGNNGDLYLGSTSGVVYLFNTINSVFVDSIGAFSSDVSGIKILNGGERIIASSYSGEVKCYNYSNNNGFGRIFSTRPEPSNILTSLSVSPSSKTAVVTSFDNMIILIDSETGKVTGSFPAHEYMIAGTLFKNEKELVSFSFGHRSFIWDLDDVKSPKYTLNGNNSSVMRIATGKHWLIFAEEDGSVFASDLKNGLKTFSVLRSLSAVTAISLDDRNDRVAVGLADGNVLIADLKVPGVVYQEKFGSKEIIALALSDKKLVVAGNDRVLRIASLSAPSGVSSVVESPLKSRFKSIAIEQNYDIVAAGTNEGVIYFIDPVNGNKVSTLSGHSMAVNSVAFDGSGKFFISGSADNTVRFWSVDEILNFKTVTNDLGFISGAVFTEGDRIMAAGEGGTVVFSGVSGVDVVKPEQNDISVEFPGIFGEQYFAALTGAGHVILWNITTGERDFVIIPEGERLQVLDIKAKTLYTNGQTMPFLFRQKQGAGATLTPEVKKATGLRIAF